MQCSLLCLRASLVIVPDVVVDDEQIYYSTDCAMLHLYLNHLSHDPAADMNIALLFKNTVE